MKIGLISDTHGSLTAWQMAYSYFKGFDLIIHCGDILYHGPRNTLPKGYDPQGLVHGLNQINEPISFVQGNCDAQVDQMLLDYPIQSPYTHVVTPSFRLLAHHGHNKTLSNKVVEQYDLIVSGHTHECQLQKYSEYIYVNPGSPALPKDKDKIPTIAVISGLIINIVDIRNGKVIKECEIIK
jgi:putative phosphoesterase